MAQKILTVHDMSDPATIREHEVVKQDARWFHCKGEGMVFDKAFCFPIEAKAELTRILEYRQGLKKQYDDSFKLILELKNQIARGEIK